MKKTLLVAAVFSCTCTFLHAQPEKDKSTVCSIRTVNFASIQDAVNAVGENDTIKVLSDVKLTSTITVAQSRPSFTFDINGHVLDGSNIPSPQTKGEKANIIESFGEMTIIDSNPESEHTDSLASIKGGIFTGGKGGYNIKEYKEGTPVYFEHLIGGAIYCLGNLTISGCTFFHNSSAYGGAIFVYDHTTTFSNCSFIENKTLVSGAGVQNQKCVTTVSNCLFSKNHSDNYAGGFGSMLGSLSMTNCKFIGNSADDGLGGGLYAYHNEAAISDCYFENNHSTGGGGYMFDSCTVVVKDCKVIDNYARGGGGGFSNYGNVNMYHCDFTNNATSYEAGGFGSWYTNLKCVNCEVKDNEATTIGGGLGIVGDAVIDNCTITGNRTVKNSLSGGIFWEDSENILLKGKTIVKDNYANGKTANLCFRKLHINDCLASIDGLTEDSEIGVTTTILGAAGSFLFTKNGTAKDTQHFKSDDSLYSVSYNDAGYLELVPATDVPTVCSNRNKKYITLQEGVYSVNKNDTIKVLDDVKLTSTIKVAESLPAFVLDINGHVLDGSNIPMATKRGETANIIGNYTDLTIIDSNPESVHTDSLASIKGGIFTGGKGGFNFSHIENDKKYYTSNLYGGAIFSKGKLTIKGGTFFRNTGYLGGAIICINVPLTISDCKFLENTATGSAGAIYSKQCESTISHCIFEKNSATSGGGLFTYYDHTTINNCSFLQNTTSKSGAGVYASRSNVTVTGSTFEGNTSVNNNGGGMIGVNSSSSLTGCTFKGNMAVRGGGCKFDTCQVEMKDCHFDANSAGRNAGGCYFLYSTANANDCNLLSNTSGSIGGGWINNSGIVTAKGCKFNGNSSLAQGGGIANFGEMTLEDCSITDNKSGSSYKSGGLYVWSEPEIIATLTLKGKTIIKDNTTNGITANLCLSAENSCCHVVLNELSQESEIGISTMMNDEDGAYQFTPNGTTDYTSCFKADNRNYLVSYNTAGYLELVNDPTAIRSIIDTDTDTSDAYDIQGRKLNEVRKGINIKSGKKILIR